MPQPSNNIFDCNNVSNFLSSPIGERKKNWKRQAKFLPHLHDKTLYQTKESQRFNDLFYYGYIHLSYKEIAEKLSISKSTAKWYLRKWEKEGKIEKKNQLLYPDLFIKSKGRNCLIKGKNYYRLTEKGKERRKGINHEAIQKIQEKSKAKILPIADKVKNLLAKESFTTHPQRNLNKLRRKEPGGGAKPHQLTFS